MVKARQIVSILDDEQDTNYDLDHDPPCPESTLPTPDVVCLPCRDPSISLYGCLSWSPWCTCHHWQRSNWKYDPHWRETPWMSNYIKCSVRPAVRWLFSASGGRRDTKNLPPWHHRLYIRETRWRGSWCRSACRDPFYGGKRHCRAARQERGATWQWLYLHIRVQGPTQSPHNRSQSLCIPCF